MTNYHPVTLTFTVAEYSILMREVVGPGGAQGLLRELLPRVNRTKRTLTLNAAQLERVRTYAGHNEGRGGYQQRFQVILDAAARAGR